jgi:hypothetical protein
LLKHDPQQAMIISAAVLGCDYSTEACGIKGCGLATLMKVLNVVCNGGLTARVVASELFPDSSESIRYAMQEIDQVTAGYIHAQYYDNDGSIVSCCGDYIDGPSDIAVQHMQGLLDPKTCQPYEYQNVIDMLKTMVGGVSSHQLSNFMDVPGARLSNQPDNCSLKELQSFLAAYQAGVSMVKSECVSAVKNFIALGSEVDLPVHDYGGSKPLLDTKVEAAGTPVRDIIAKLLIMKEIEQDAHISSLLSTVQRMFADNDFTDDYDMIARCAPEITEEHISLLYDEVFHLKNSKARTKSFSKAAEKDSRICHINMQPSEDVMIIVSKQPASMSKDPTTRKKTAEGERPLRKEYTCFIELSIEATTIERHHHELGRVKEIRRSFCTCKVGNSKSPKQSKVFRCVHIGMALYDQIHHWNEGRGTPKPTTMVLQEWAKPSNKKRRHESMKPIGELTIERIDKNKPIKAYRRCSDIFKEPTEVLTDEEKQKMKEVLNPERFRSLCQALAQDKRQKRRGRC